MKSKFLIFLLGMSGACAEARVFDINKESFAGYFLGSGGSSALGVNAVQDETASTLTYSGGVNYNYSGEFGFIYSKSRVSVRFGIEVLKPSLLESTATASSVEYYSTTSEILGYVPKLAVELNLHGNQVSRSFVSFAGGLANVTMKNEYTLTSAGTSALGASNHTAESKGSGTLLAASLGYENILTDTTTIAIEFGYRQMKINNLQYTKDVTTFSGAKVSGDKVTKSDGSARELDFSGGFIALGFRFYL